MRVALLANTSLTATVKQDVAELQIKVQPVLDTIKTMEAGVRTIGRIGDLGSAVLKVGIYTIALWVLLKLLLLGASWSEAFRAFQEALGK